MEWSEVKSSQLRKLSAAIGTGAVIAMGALTIALSGEDAPTETVISDPEVTLGETSTETTAPTVIETSIAIPEVTAEPPDGF